MPFRGRQLNFSSASKGTKDYNVVVPDLPGHGESSKFFIDKYDLINHAQMEKIQETATEYLIFIKSVNN
jgi:pimeloyl-ACP methyl ester carboxylesterase